MVHWLRFRHEQSVGFGVLKEGRVEVYEGDMFDVATSTGVTLGLEEVEVLMPCVPGKMLALWNNFYALAEKLGMDTPPEPLYWVKTEGCYLGHGEKILKPVSYDGKVVFEGELGIVIGSMCRGVTEVQAPDHIFGYTCINDVTAVEIVNRDETFPQWTRAKSFDTFGVMGPVIATDLDPQGLVVQTFLTKPGTAEVQERQNYPVSDMVFSPISIVSKISQDVTLFPGDVICCGTSIGVGSMRPGTKIEVKIDGIGTLSNFYEEN
ncbi:MAG: 2-hydroxyhepta-2,4-diene-1,7-dioate isomerase [Gemmatimonadetes bacterium]|nr:2-hydroxyhepta-2,4-diene-1,7-dioate isomerase [Gemmatimonadota bacterium]